MSEGDEGAVGVVLREAQVLATLFDARGWLVVSGLSGIVGALGVCFASSAILRTLYAGVRAPRAAATTLEVQLPAGVP